MSNNSNEAADYDDVDMFTLETPFSRILNFSILITCLIPAMICTLVIFYYFIRLRDLWAKQQHHV